MKNIFSTLITIGFLLPVQISAQQLSSGTDKKTFGESRISGTLGSASAYPEADTVYFVYQNGSENISLEAPVTNRKFSITIPLIAPDMTARMSAGNWFGKNARRIVLENGPVKITVEKDMQSARVEGGIQNKALDAYESATRALMDEMDSLRTARYRKTIDSVVYVKEMKDKRTALDTAKMRFIRAHPYSWRTVELMDEYVKHYLANDWAQDPQETGLKKYKTMLSQLQEPALSATDYLKKHLQNAEENRLIPFTGELPDGGTFDVASLKGRVFLIDFWGSWCHWCRKGHPHLKELYAKYKGQGFEIVGIGHEYGNSRPEQWKKFKDAIAMDGITWIQILNDPQKQDLTKDYLVYSYPSKFLVDQNGKIILRVGDDSERLIDAKLEELLGKPASE